MSLNLMGNKNLTGRGTTTIDAVRDIGKRHYANNSGIALPILQPLYLAYIFYKSGR